MGENERITSSTGEVHSFHNEDYSWFVFLSFFIPSFFIKLITLFLFLSLSDAINQVVQFLGMMPAEGSEKAEPNAKRHILYLGGRFAGDVPVLSRARMMLQEGGGVQMELIVRSPSQPISTVLASSL